MTNIYHIFLFLFIFVMQLLFRKKLKVICLYHAFNGICKLKMNKRKINNVMIKNPCGTCDTPPNKMCMYKYIFDKLEKIFKKYDATQIDTPVIECLDIVKGIYGDEFNKLVYYVKSEDDNNVKEELILRYDLTVPLSRYIAANGLDNFRRYQIGKVYRKDKPQIYKGRFREFWQCDFDIIGEHNNLMLHETEIMSILVESLSSLIDKNKFKIIINDRTVLYYVLKTFDISHDLFNKVCAVLDKLDKLDKSNMNNVITFIKKELDEILSTNSIDKLCEFITILINMNNISPLEKLSELKKNKFIDSIIFDKLTAFFQYLIANEIYEYITFDPLLARGLDYYTGLIYEAVYLDKNIMPSSIAGGGRYDGIIGKFKNKHIPAIGLSIGIDRIITILEKNKRLDDNQLRNKYDIYIASVGKKMAGHRLKAALDLRKAGFNVKTNYKNNPKMRFQLDEVFNNMIPFMVVIGQNEIDNNIVQFKDINKNVQIELKRDDLSSHLFNEIKLINE